MENAVLDSANALTFISQSLFLAGSFSNKIFIIPNGYDPDDFKNIEHKKNTKFTITFVGNLSKSQYLDNLLEALISLDSDVFNSILFKIYGNIHDELKEKLNNSTIEKIVYTESYTSHRKFINNIVNSDLLLLVIPKTKHNKGIVTGKLFEYLATSNYILGIGPHDGDAAKILAETNRGEMFDYDEPLDKIILDCFQKWQKNGEKLKFNLSEVDKYSRLNLTAQLVDVFKSVMNQ
jgi:glycosyltransferase involved in cell wall biosynthesis